MAWYNEDNPETLNFVIVGNQCSGHELLQSSLAAHPEIVCHGDLLNKKESIRKLEHENYFGCSDKVPDWYQPHLLSAEQYLNNKIFDNGLNNEKAIGVRLDYATLVDDDIWDYLDQKCRAGDFCLIHVTRNPVACFVDYCIANRLVDPIGISSHRSYLLNGNRLSAFVREHIANEMKVNRFFHDRATISYHELMLDFRGTLQNVFKFLGLPFSSACIPNRKRANVKDLRHHISNYSQLESELPLDVLDFFRSPLLV